MGNIKRQLNIDLPQGQSAFLWGARKCGKTTWLKEQFPDSLYYDFLKSDLYLTMLKEPKRLREELLLKKPDKVVILDEVQKIPQLLDEVHYLIENAGISFILCGSSARKLKRGQANLLGGRAWRFEMLPLTSKELDKQFDLITILNRGLIPNHTLSPHYIRSLKAYIQDYLREEIFAEGLTRNIAAFSNFLDSVVFSQGELVNYSNIARDCAVDSKTIKEYYQILVDTHIGYFVYPFKPRSTRQIISATPKFYLFDVGVANALAQIEIKEAKGEHFGRSFEHFIFMELNAHRKYYEIDYPIEFWRTKNGFEVDFILNKGEIAIEVKGKNKIHSKDLKNLKIFNNDYHPKKSYIVCNEERARIVDNIIILPYKEFLNQLWNGQIL
ncbi:MAG: ATP-binding protein [Candidatus Marinimicrobia bacterium]|nr:ATP-binding protein [Candidatus Neomarinimicrobiota bacterium]